MKVLILEDEKPIRDLLCINLKRAGFEIAETSTGEEALSIAREQRDFDIAILDLMLPGLSGFEVCTLLRAQFPGWESLCSRPKARKSTRSWAWNPAQTTT